MESASISWSHHEDGKNANMIVRELTESRGGGGCMGRWGRFRFFVNITLRWSSVLLLFHHLCHNIVSNMLQSYLFYLYWNPHTWKLRYRHQNHLLITTKQKLWHIYPIKVWNWQPSWIFSCFSSFYTHKNGLPCCIMCLSDSLTKKI